MISLLQAQLPAFEITAGDQAMSTILDFQIQSINAESYSLTVCERSSSQSLASAIFSHRVDFLTDFNVDRLNASTKDPAERFDELQKLGRELYQKLFPPAVEQVWQKYKQRSEFLILCLRFAEDAAKLEVLPWETLHDGAEFIAAGAKTTLTRLPLDVAPPSELPPIPRPLKLFGFFASPLDLGDHERLKAEREQEILLEAINDPNAQGRISVEIEDEAKLEILERSLKDGYHILHFTGHGISPRDGGGLLLEDAQGKKLPASIADVMQAVERGQEGKAKLRLAVISGCQTARTLHTVAFSDLVRELLRQWRGGQRSRKRRGSFRPNTSLPVLLAVERLVLARAFRKIVTTRNGAMKNIRCSSSLLMLCNYY